MNKARRRRRTANPKLSVKREEPEIEDEYDNDSQSVSSQNSSEGNEDSIFVDLIAVYEENVHNLTNLCAELASQLESARNLIQKLVNRPREVVKANLEVFKDKDYLEEVIKRVLNQASSNLFTNQNKKGHFGFIASQAKLIEALLKHMNYKELTTDFGNGSKIKNGKFLDNLDPGFPTKPNLNDPELDEDELAKFLQNLDISLQNGNDELNTSGACKERNKLKRKCLAKLKKDQIQNKKFLKISKKKLDSKAKKIESLKSECDRMKKELTSKSGIWKKQKKRLENDRRRLRRENLELEQQVEFLMENEDKDDTSSQSKDSSDSKEPENVARNVKKTKNRKNEKNGELKKKQVGRHSKKMSLLEDDISFEDEGAYNQDGGDFEDRSHVEGSGLKHSRVLARKAFGVSLGEEEQEGSDYGEEEQDEDQNQDQSSSEEEGHSKSKNRRNKLAYSQGTFRSQAALSHMKLGDIRKSQKASVLSKHGHHDEGDENQSTKTRQYKRPTLKPKTRNLKRSQTSKNPQYPPKTKNQKTRKWGQNGGGDHAQEPSFASSRGMLRSLIINGAQDQDEEVSSCEDLNTRLSKNSPHFGQHSTTFEPAGVPRMDQLSVEDQVLAKHYFSENPGLYSDRGSNRSLKQFKLEVGEGDNVEVNIKNYFSSQIHPGTKIQEFAQNSPPNQIPGSQEQERGLAGVAPDARGLHQSSYQSSQFPEGSKIFEKNKRKNFMILTRGSETIKEHLEQSQRSPKIDSSQLSKINQPTAKFKTPTIKTEEKLPKELKITKKKQQIAKLAGMGQGYYQNRRLGTRKRSNSMRAILTEEHRIRIKDASHYYNLGPVRRKEKDRMFSSYFEAEGSNGFEHFRSHKKGVRGFDEDQESEDCDEVRRSDDCNSSPERFGAESSGSVQGFDLGCQGGGEGAERQLKHLHQSSFVKKVNKLIKSNKKDNKRTQGHLRTGSQAYDSNKHLGQYGGGMEPWTAPSNSLARPGHQGPLQSPNTYNEPKLVFSGKEGILALAQTEPVASPSNLESSYGLQLQKMSFGPQRLKKASVVHGLRRSVSSDKLNFNSPNEAYRRARNHHEMLSSGNDKDSYNLGVLSPDSQIFYTQHHNGAREVPRGAGEAFTGSDLSKFGKNSPGLHAPFLSPGTRDENLDHVNTLNGAGSNDYEAYGSGGDEIEAKTRHQLLHRFGMNRRFSKPYIHPDEALYYSGEQGEPQNQPKTRKRAKMARSKKMRSLADFSGLEHLPDHIRDRGGDQESLGESFKPQFYKTIDERRLNSAAFDPAPEGLKGVDGRIKEKFRNHLASSSFLDGIYVNEGFRYDKKTPSGSNLTSGWGQAEGLKQTLKSSPEHFQEFHRASNGYPEPHGRENISGEGSEGEDIPHELYHPQPNPRDQEGLKFTKEPIDAHQGHGRGSRGAPISKIKQKIRGHRQSMAGFLNPEKMTKAKTLSHFYSNRTLQDDSGVQGISQNSFINLPKFSKKLLKKTGRMKPKGTSKAARDQIRQPYSSRLEAQIKNRRKKAKGVKSIFVKPATSKALIPAKRKASKLGGRKKKGGKASKERKLYCGSCKEAYENLQINLHKIGLKHSNVPYKTKVEKVDKNTVNEFSKFFDHSSPHHPTYIFNGSMNHHRDHGEDEEEDDHDHHHHHSHHHHQR